MNTKADVLLGTKSILGEGAWFDVQRKVLLWLDIFGCEIHEYDVRTKTDTCHRVEKPVTTIVPAADGYALGMIDGVWSIDSEFKKLTRMPTPEYDYAHYRCNEGKCAPDGRLWIGIMELEGKSGMGAYYAVDGKTCELMLDNLDVPNGIVWNSTHDRMYYTDTVSRRIYGVDYRDGKISNQSTIFVAPDGMPDGMTIDENDHIWAAVWGAGCVYHIDPVSGSVLGKVEISAPQASSVAIGDSRMYITSARLSMSDEDLKKHPDSGAVFVADVPVRGIEAFRFKY
ncbi:MAG: SMP-30/gluconolactonase/LRE family protein [Phycisphaerae bacterium]|nr:SMP-30/gluconolactonase/LRE family protein [Phycisphaerae bacterium]